MRYEKKTVKQFILNYHNTIDNNVTLNEDIGTDDFFNVNDQSETHELNNSDVEDVIFFNELESVVERVATEKEHDLFLLLSNGVILRRLEVYLVFGRKELGRC